MLLVLFLLVVSVVAGETVLLTFIGFGFVELNSKFVELKKLLFCSTERKYIKILFSEIRISR